MAVNPSPRKERWYCNVCMHDVCLVEDGQSILAVDVFLHTVVITLSHCMCCSYIVLLFSGSCIL